MVFYFIEPLFLMVLEWDLPKKLQSQKDTFEILVLSMKISKYFLPNFCFLLQ